MTRQPMTPSDRADFDRGQAFAELVTGAVNVSGPPDLSDDEKRVLSDLLIVTASNWTRRRVALARGLVTDPLHEPMERCLLVLQELDVDDARDAALNVLARIIHVQAKARKAPLHVALEYSRAMAKGLSECIETNWSKS